MREQLVQVEFRQGRVELSQESANTYHYNRGKGDADQGVKRLIRCLACLETIIDFVLPGAHLHYADKFWLNNRLAVQHG